MSGDARVGRARGAHRGGAARALLGRAARAVLRPRRPRRAARRASRPGRRWRRSRSAGIPREIRERLVEEHLLHPRRYGAPVRRPVVSMEEPSFRPGFNAYRTWRGAAWVNTAWLLVGGAARARRRRRGRPDRPRRRRRRRAQRLPRVLPPAHRRRPRRAALRLVDAAARPPARVFRPVAGGSAASVKLLVVTPEPIDAALPAQDPRRRRQGRRGARPLARHQPVQARVLGLRPRRRDRRGRRPPQTDTVERLEEEGIDAAGEVGESDPAQAIDDALATFAADRIVIFSPPRGRPRLPRGRIARGRRVTLEPPRHARPDLSLSRTAHRRRPSRSRISGARTASRFEGYYWRFAGADWSVCAIAGVCRDARGTWAMVTLASEPDGFERTEIVDVASIGRDRLRRGRRTAAGRRDVAARGDLGPGSGGALRGAARTGRGAVRPARPGADGPVARPVLGAASARRPRVRLATASRSLDGADVYAEKNWGAAFADHWWWGQGPGVAFAGGRIHGVAPTAVVAWTPDGVVSLAPPFARTVARAGGGEWHIRAKSAALAGRDRGRGGRRAAAAGAAAAGAAARAALEPPPAGRLSRARVARAAAVARERGLWRGWRTGRRHAGYRRG